IRPGFAGFPAAKVYRTSPETGLARGMHFTGPGWGPSVGERLLFCSLARLRFARAMPRRIMPAFGRPVLFRSGLARDCLPDVHGATPLSSGNRLKTAFAGTGDPGEHICTSDLGVPRLRG